MPEWQNWSGNVVGTPVRLEAPATEDEVGALVTRARDDGLPVRVAGTRHSFTPLCLSDGIAVDLFGLTGVESVDPVARTATILGGTRLADIGAPLRAAGLALHNQGDVDVQTITGAIGTGTHGTGPNLANLSSAVVAVRIVTADGDLQTWTPDDGGATAERFQAARLSLGSLGIITAVTMQCVDAYNLHERVWFEDTDHALAALDERIAATRHYEFFWHPRRDLCEHKSLALTDAVPDDLPARKRERIGESYRIFPTVREQRFNEMEYAVPAAAGPACFAELRRVIRRDFPDLDWPIEYRTLAADDVWLSPAFGRDSVTLSVHEAAALPYDRLFDACEQIFLAHDGRPHWGKLHSRRARELAPTSPEWTRFTAARASADPDGVFLNDYLRALFDIPRSPT